MWRFRLFAKAWANSSIELRMKKLGALASNMPTCCAGANDKLRPDSKYRVQNVSKLLLGWNFFAGVEHTGWRHKKTMPSLRR